MRWHSINKSNEVEIMRHPCNGELWSHFNAMFLDSVQDLRNIRLGLASDDFNLTMTLSYSM